MHAVPLQRPSQIAGFAKANQELESVVPGKPNLRLARNSSIVPVVLLEGSSNGGSRAVLPFSN